MALTTRALPHGHVVFTCRTKTSLSAFSEQHALLFHFHRPHNPSLSLPHSIVSSSSSVQLLHHHSSRGHANVNRVSTVSIEYVPSAPDDFNFQREIARLQSLRLRIANAGGIEHRHQVLDADSRVKRFFNTNRGSLARVLESMHMGMLERYLIKCLVAAGQEHVLSYGLDTVEREFGTTARSSLKGALNALVEMIESWDGGGKKLGNHSGSLSEAKALGALKNLLKTLREVEDFYDCIGGIIGYQITVLEYLAESTSQTINRPWHVNEAMNCHFVEIHSPSGLDLSQDTEYANKAALWGLEGLPKLGEIYPLGGSADRLGLVDSVTGEYLPAAMLPYGGHTLLEGLIRDLQAREFLYFKLYGKQCIIPVAIMTSAAKNNHERITSLCEKLRWFGRGQSRFQLFEQPLVPAVSAEDGEWLVAEPFTPVCKPGGHGVIWKLAYDKGVFQWFYNHGRSGATVRQVSNVAAATDLTLLALAGIGLQHRKKLGFASCKRSSGATEGINVLMEKKELDGKWAYGLSCVEYTEFNKFGITEGPCFANGLQVEFPANTNILYVDLQSVEQVAARHDATSLPGMVLNIKKPIEFVDHFGVSRRVSGGRLECTMQNIADNFCNRYSSRCYKDVEDTLDTFMVYNERRRVTSSAKKKRTIGSKSLHQTPDGALLDMIRNAREILSHCSIKLPEIGSNDDYIDSGLPFLVLLHPALGPLWQVTRQKFCGGSISKGSELQIEVAEFCWRDVEIDGSLIVKGENSMGSMRINNSGEHILQYGRRCARCKLQNVKVLNRGIDWESQDNIFWKHEVQRHESVKVLLHGNAEFEASDVTVEGNHVFEVPDGCKLKITSGNPGLSVQLDPIDDDKMECGSWFWNYSVEGAHIRLEFVEP